MKVLSIASDSAKGGATISLLNTLKGLKKDKKVEIHVVTPRDGYLCRELDRSSIPYSIFPFCFSIWPAYTSFGDILLFPLRLFKIIIRNIIALMYLIKVVIAFKPDIIHTNVSVVNLGYYVSKIFKIPHIWHIREYGDQDFDMKHFPSKAIFKKWLDSSYTIAITHDLKNYFNLAEKCHVIYNGIEDSDTDYSEITKKDKTIIFVGRLSENKGTTLLIDAFKKFLRFSSEYRLELIGSADDKYVKYLKKCKIPDNLSDYIHIIGPQADIYARMQKSKAIVVPSRCEGFGRITAEAMINKCLVLGRNTGGTKEQLDNGLQMCFSEVGLRFDDVESLFHQLCTFSTMDECTYNKMLDNARKTVQSLYTVSKNVDETYNFLKYISNRCI